MRRTRRRRQPRRVRACACAGSVYCHTVADVPPGRELFCPSGGTECPHRTTQQKREPIAAPREGTAREDLRSARIQLYLRQRHFRRSVAKILSQYRSCKDLGATSSAASPASRWLTRAEKAPGSASIWLCAQDDTEETSIFPASRSERSSAKVC